MTLEDYRRFYAEEIEQVARPYRGFDMRAARANLSSYSHAVVETGVTHPRALWLDRLQRRRPSGDAADGRHQPHDRPG